MESLGPPLSSNRICSIPRIVVCPISSELIDAQLFRVVIQPTPANGLRKPSQVMVDKLIVLRRERITKRAGVITLGEMERIDSARRLWLGINGGS